MPTKLFRKAPPKEFFTEVLKQLHVQYHRWFSKDDLSFETLESWLPELESYYIPCKADRFLHNDFSKHRCITVLRHLAPLYGIEIQSQEKVLNGHKATLYMLNPSQYEDLSGSTGEVVVEFL
jgi:hypothetical protein